MWRAATNCESFANRGVDVGFSDGPPTLSPFGIGAARARDGPRNQRSSPRPCPLHGRSHPANPLLREDQQMPVTSLARLPRVARRISAPPAVRPLSILIVDDGNRQGLVELLRTTFGEQASVRECDSGLAALEILRHGRIDVVLVDH